MFCSKCGCQLNDATVFCHKCGTKISMPVEQNNNAVKKAKTVELDREALQIYLYDILTLECVRNKYNAKLNRIKNQLSSTGNYFEKRYTLTGDEAWKGVRDDLYFLHKNGKNYIFAKKDSLDGTYAITEDLGYRMPYRDWNSYTSKCLESSGFLDIEENFRDLSGLSMWSSWPVTYESGFFAKRRKASKARDMFLRCYEDFKKIAGSGLDNTNRNREVLQNNYNGITKELDVVNKLLSKEYNLNIIPSNFRNITAVYYLYDFIKTSNQSFTTALMHFDLHEIKSKLDIVIQQNQEIIIQQAYIISQNQRTIEQNQACLKRLSNLERTASNIEYNTAQAATYSSIAANNAEVCAWIGIANYLKN